MEGGVGHWLGTRENVSEGNTGDFRRQSGAGHARLGAATGTVSPPRDPHIEGSRRHDGKEAGATTDANDDDPPPSPTWTPRHFEPRILPTDIFVKECGIEGHARGTHPSSSTEPMLYMTAAIVHVAVDRARVG